MKAVNILNRYKLKRTSCREGILEVVLNANNALSENEIKEKLAGNYDRTTFYRSFKTLEEHHIIHKIVVDNQMVKYALDHSLTNEAEHVHFYCSECQTVRCLKDTPIQKYPVPVGYSDQETEVLIKGICAKCNEQQEKC